MILKTYFPTSEMPIPTWPDIFVERLLHALSLIMMQRMNFVVPVVRLGHFKLTNHPSYLVASYHPSLQSIGIVQKIYNSPVSFDTCVVGDAESARNENTRKENAALYCMPWKYETWKCGTMLRGMKMRHQKRRGENGKSETWKWETWKCEWVSRV